MYVLQSLDCSHLDTVNVPGFEKGVRLVEALGVYVIRLSHRYSVFIVIGFPQCGQALFPVFDLRFQLLQLLHILPVGFDGVSAFSAGIELFINPVGESVFLLLANGTGIG